MGLVLDQPTKGGMIKIKALMKDGSAQQSAQLREGDELVRVDGRAVAEMTVAQATDLIMNGYRVPANSAAATPIKPIGRLSPIEGKKPSGKPCGIGLTILDHPPHLVTYISPDGPAARSHAIDVGDALVAINKELVADMAMEELVQRVVGEEVLPLDCPHSHNYYSIHFQFQSFICNLENSTRQKFGGSIHVYMYIYSLYTNEGTHTHTR